MATTSTEQRQVVPSKLPITKFPLIDNDPHFKRVIRYMRPSDYYAGAGASIIAPATMLWWERVSPSYAGRGGFASVFRLSVALGICGGFLLAYERSCQRFYGMTENDREAKMDMREMVDKAKRGEPLYGESTMSEHLQGVAARNSRYSSMFLHVLPFFNFVNHDQHGVDTAKYYRQAETELEQENGRA